MLGIPHIVFDQHLIHYTQIYKGDTTLSFIPEIFVVW